jgi:threonyl-tRNA synthetase
MSHPVYDLEKIEKIDIVHYEAITIGEKYLYFKRYAYLWMKFFRKTFDFFTNYGEKNMTIKKWLFRLIFLETIAGVPGMVAAMTLHMKSLRNCELDKGYIFTLL